MTINNLEELYQGHGYRRGANLYPDTETLVRPFVDSVSPYVDGYSIQVQTPSDVAVDVVEQDDREQVEEYKVYSRVLVEGILKPEYQLTLGHDDHYTKTIGFLYALDTQQPIVKCYSGWLRQVCTNLAVFNPNGIVTKHFSASDFQSIYESPLKFIQDIQTERSQFEEHAATMSSVSYGGDELKKLLGHLAVQCLAKNPGMGTAYSNLVKMIQSNRDVATGVKNHYYKQSGEYTKYDLYQGLTGTLSAKADISSRPDVIYKAFKLFHAN